MIPIISFVGKSGSGKTTLIEKLIPELKKRGYRIGVVKHTHHEVKMDKNGKDSTRHKEAGAEMVILASSGRISMVRDLPYDSLKSLEIYFSDLDLVITEGFKKEDKPKIEVFRLATHKTPLFNGSKDFAAIVTDADIKPEIPVFGLNDIKDIADFIESRYL
ncbi:Molybdopterin-guanine dinucleotide biosynthesis adapter protein [Desulfonema limicola]|uniref:Molybdopterin-guanine dinucleotide biosynthesis adapter protein n=1 Tax=Desulfonema limicola TaxID=45656 RepID=A0A975GIG5_9BACT|nr:molybdopterin-guanine dinucleotide biosynthesis protein B [Desulfonema limicola]QTA82319.1 Molybdopterin-guanine dinucleotide biosynthesis adapter protein [Desulfonema limicola]